MSKIGSRVIMKIHIKRINFKIIFKALSNNCFQRVCTTLDYNAIRFYWQHIWFDRVSRRKKIQQRSENRLLLYVYF